MSDAPQSNAKIYPRPEKKPPSPIMLALSLIVALIVGFFVYRALFHAVPAANPGDTVPQLAPRETRPMKPEDGR